MKQIGPVKLSGGTDDLIFYQTKNGHYVRRKPHISKQRRKHAPSLQPQRDNAAEFALANVAAKILRRAFKGNLENYFDKKGDSELVKIIRHMIIFGDGDRGQRDFNPVKFKHMLKDFNLKHSLPFEKLCLAPFTFSVSPDRNEVTLHVPDFSEGMAIFAPKGLTHYKLTFGIGTISGYTWDPQVSYRPLNDKQNGLQCRVRTQAFKCNDRSNPGFDLTLQLPNLLVLSPTTLLTATIGIDFYTYTNGELTHDPENMAMKVIGVF